MRALVFLSVLSVVVCGGCKYGSGGVRPVSKPGVEFYSWQEGGAWLFALLDVTNRAKQEKEIKATPLKMADIDSYFAGYDKDERILWYVTRFSQPDASIVHQVELVARKHDLQLVLVE